MEWLLVLIIMLPFFFKSVKYIYAYIVVTIGCLILFQGQSVQYIGLILYCWVKAFGMVAVPVIVLLHFIKWADSWRM